MPPAWSPWPAYRSPGDLEAERDDNHATCDGSMSHKASHWLAEIPARAINAGAFRVLFHLCDAHNSQRDPETACFPSQERLRAATGLSNGGLNNALNALEATGLIRRRRTRNADGTIGPTYYILGCDFGPHPQNGDGLGRGKSATSPVDKPVDNHVENEGITNPTISTFGRPPSPVEWSITSNGTSKRILARARVVAPATEAVAVGVALGRAHPGLVRAPPASQPADVNQNLEVGSRIALGGGALERKE